MNRIAIFSLYDEEGYVYDYVKYYLHNLQYVSKRIIVVVNGKLSEAGEKIIKEYTSEVIKRNNTGFDAGAYKECILNYIDRNNLMKYDELILCNDTCFGPVISFDEIFREMQYKKCDFWGMKKITTNCFEHIQSYFLVFKKNILEDEIFYKYWKECIDETSVCIKDVYGSFEQGIYRLLSHSGYVGECYGKSGNINNYASNYHCLCAGDVLIKKKFLDTRYNSMEDIMNTLYYLKIKQLYNLEMIYEYAERKYQLTLPSKISANKEVKCIYFESMCLDEGEIVDLCRKYNHIYVYGAGVYAYCMYYMLNYYDIRITNFFVSDKKKVNTNNIHGIEIIEWGAVNVGDDGCIVVALNKNNTEAVKQNIANTKNVICLWQD